MKRPTLTLITAPASEPLTLAEAKTWCRIDGTDEDSALTGLITAARATAEEYLRRALITQTWKMSLDLPCSGLNSRLGAGVYDLPASALYGDAARTAELPKGMIQSVTSVVTYDTSNTATTMDPANYRLSDSRLVLNPGSFWPTNIRPVGGIEITYVAGYGNAAAVPQPIKTGMLIHLASLYEQRGMCEDAMDLPPGTKRLYDQYRIMGDRCG